MLSPMFVQYKTLRGRSNEAFRSSGRGGWGVSVRSMMLQVAMTAFLFAVFPGRGRAEERTDIQHRQVEVAVRGANMHFEIWGTGKQVILLEAGATYGVDAWTSLAENLARESGATIIAYDRAGMGGSDHIDSPFDIHEAVGRLHGALYQLGMRDDLILVGHSFGGYMIQLYSNIYPESVKGLVYVDSNTVLGLDLFGGAQGPASGIVKANDVAHPTKKQKSNVRLGQGYVAAHEMMRRYPVVCGIPIIVVTAAKESEDGIDDKALWGWREGQNRLARDSGATQILAQKSGHMVPFDEPEAIVDAVRRVIRQQKADSKIRLGVPEQLCSVDSSLSPAD